MKVNDKIDYIIMKRLFIVIFLPFQSITNQQKQLDGLPERLGLMSRKKSDIYLVLVTVAAIKV